MSRRCAPEPECNYRPSVSAQTQEPGGKPGSACAYGQLAETIFKLLTSTDGRFAMFAMDPDVVPLVVAPAVAVPAVDPVVPAVAPVVPLRLMLGSHVVLPIT
jgi:hypothetical protein